MSAAVRRTTVAKGKASAGPQSVNKRLQTELMNMMKNPIDSISAFPEGDDLFKWTASVKGVDETMYASLEFKLSIEFGPTYPLVAPTVRFDTPCFHPNVDQSGNICLDILKEKWSPVQTVSSVLLSIQALLGEPNNDSPYNAHAAELWDRPEEFYKAMIARYHEGTSASSKPFSASSSK